MTDLPDRPIRRVPLVSLLVASLGFALLVISVRQVGWSTVASSFRSLGPWLVVVIALGAARMAFRARAWALCAGHDPQTRIPFGDAFKAVLAADALGNLTPLGLLASEPAKVMLARRHLGTVSSLSSVAVENGFYALSVLAMLLGGTWALLQRADVPQALERAGELVVAVSIVAAAAGLWAFRTRPAVLSRVWPLLARVTRRSPASADSVTALESNVYDVVHWPAARLAHVGVWEVLFHVAAVAEVWLILRALPGGAAVTLVDAFLMETTGRFITVAFKFIPYRLGIDEIGSGSVSQLLGLGAPAGVALALIRRVRILVLNACGIAILARHR